MASFRYFATRSGSEHRCASGTKRQLLEEAGRCEENFREAPGELAQSGLFNSVYGEQSALRINALG